MHRLLVFLLAFFALESGGIVVSRAAVKSYNELSAMQLMALQDSEGRLLHDDQALSSLQDKFIHHKINSREFALQDRELTACIAEEAAFQNAVLTKQSTFPGHSEAVLRTIGKYSIYIPAYLAEVVAEGLAGSHTTVSP